MASTKTKRVKKPIDIDFNVKVTLDNTAPLNQIVEDLHRREYQSRAYSLYHKLLAHRRNSRAFTRKAYHFTLPGHPLNAFTEGFDGGIGNDYFEEFSYKSLMPKMITKIRNIEKTDPVTKLMREKRDWKNKVCDIKRVHMAKYSSRVKLEVCNDEVIQCPKYMVEMAEILESDPDPNFTDCYNWYYSGSGNLQLVCINWVDYLLHSEFSCVYLSRFTTDNLAIDFENTVSFNCGDEYDIRETVCSPQNIVALRTKYKIFILKIEEQENNLLFRKLRCFESEVTFTGISFDKHHTNILYATTLDCKLTIVNIDRMTKRSLILKQKPELKDNWNCVVGASRGMFMHIQRDSVTAYDKRTNKVVNTWSGVKRIVDELDCNVISAAVQLEGTDKLYFTTNHHLFLMDTRCSKASNMKVVQRWTHGMQCVPTFISVQDAEFNKELIFMSSQWCEDMCVVSNYSDRLSRQSDIDGVSIPYRPPSIFNVLYEAQQKRLCWDLYNPIKNRLPMSISGMVEVRRNNQFVILMHNSLGDISSHVLYPSYMENLMEDNALQELHEWSKNYVIKRKPFEVTNVHDISGLWKKLKAVSKHDIDLIIQAHQPIHMKVDEQQVYSTFQNEEVMPELLDVWKNDQPEETVAEETRNLSLQFTSDSE
ncbi:uncharacterized protein LOC113510713 [Galleria mellonella]|uniref:Uncharacterized protein LOC113510713 n=1 Tax=Galleria mellonella TaxID=7137 RepID=A0A6J1WAX6_GALME|nr:uncharacterized protein LOC113510713 [Galleria mellonella]